MNNIMNSINGVWRKIETPFVNVNGVWRESSVMIMKDGIWRVQHEHIQASDIIGFVLVYKLNTKMKHPDFPELSFNRKVPVEVALTGDTAGSMDYNEKGIVFRYVREGYKEDPPYLGWKDEGIVMYTGTLYAVLTDNSLVDILHTDSPIDQSMEITIEGWYTYESYGYNLNGWNSLFSTETLLDPTSTPDKEIFKNIKQLNSYIILPNERRVDTFDSVASIGIARDMTSELHNMVGSRGALRHTMINIIVNGVAKPFVVKLYH